MAKKQGVTKKGEGNLIDVLARIEKKIDNMHTVVNVNKDYLTTKEACAHLGCSRVSLWRLVKDNKIVLHKTETGKTYYALADLKKYLNNPAAIAETI